MNHYSVINDMPTRTSLVRKKKEEKKKMEMEKWTTTSTVATEKQTIYCQLCLFCRFAVAGLLMVVGDVDAGFSALKSIQFETIRNQMSSAFLQSCINATDVILLLHAEGSISDLCDVWWNKLGYYWLLFTCMHYQARRTLKTVYDLILFGLIFSFMFI